MGDTCWAGGAPWPLPSQRDPQHPAGFPEIGVQGKRAPSGQPDRGVIAPELQDGRSPTAQPKSPSFPATPPPWHPRESPGCGQLGSCCQTESKLLSWGCSPPASRSVRHGVSPGLPPRPLRAALSPAQCGWGAPGPPRRAVRVWAAGGAGWARPCLFPSSVAGLPAQQHLPAVLIRNSAWLDTTSPLKGFGHNVGNEWFQRAGEGGREPRRPPHHA